jgi:hypothetical protein
MAANRFLNVAVRSHATVSVYSALNYPTHSGGNYPTIDTHVEVKSGCRFAQKKARVTIHFHRMRLSTLPRMLQ